MRSGRKRFGYARIASDIGHRTAQVVAGPSPGYTRLGAMHTSWIYIYLTIGWLIRLGMVPTVLRRDFAPGAAIAWLGVVFLHPYIGGTLYALVGEARLSPARVRKHRELVSHFRDRDWEEGGRSHAE